MTTTYGQIGERQGGDPNILKLGASTKLRPLDGDIADWRQHAIEDPNDPQKTSFVVCPGTRSCPLCRKPTKPDGEPYWGYSQRYAANVWDFESNSVKVLVAGPQVFDEFRVAMKAGIEPWSCDWTIVKEGSGLKTKYSVVRHNAAPGPSVTPDQLHDVRKYEARESPENIFDILEKYGIDFDSLPVPHFDLDEALSFVMPYTSAKGLTIEKFLDTDLSKAQWLHGTKLEQNQLGDQVFLALQVGLEARGLVPPLDDALAAMPEPEAAPEPEPVPEPEPAAASVASEVPHEPAAGQVTLLAVNGLPVDVPESSVESLLAAGFTRPEPEPAEPDSEPGNMIVVVNGQKVEMEAGTAETLIAAGAAEKYEPEAKPEPKIPAADEQVEIEVNGTPVSMEYAHAEPLVAAGAAKFLDEEVAAAHAGQQEQVQDKDDQAAVRAQAEAEQSSPASQPPEPDDPAKPHKCPHCTKSFKTKGGLTQHANKEHANAEAPAEAAAPAAPATASSNGAADEDLLERVKDKIAKSPFAKDYSTILEIFDTETGKKNVMEMTGPELEKLEARIDKEIAAK